MSIFRRKVRGQRLKTYSAKFMYSRKLYRRDGFPDKATAQHWLDSTKLALRRGAVGYIKSKTKAGIHPLIDEYVEELEANGRDDKYCDVTKLRLIRLAKDIPWLTTGDITSESFERWRAARPRSKKRPIGAKTLNQYLDHAMQFAKWLHKSKRLLHINPLSDVPKRSAPANAAYRRAATMEELEKLLKAAPADRAAIYMFLVYIPLRRDALEKICWRDLDLTGDRPTLTLPAKLSKNRREAKMAIRADLAAKLIEWRGKKSGDELVFDSIPRVRELRTDLKAAGVAFDDGKGARRLDLHAFRKTVIRLLKRNGVSLDDAQIFLQHRDRRTTEKYYDDDQVEPGVMTAAEKMPALSGLSVGAQVGAQKPSDTMGPP